MLVSVTESLGCMQPGAASARFKTLELETLKKAADIGNAGGRGAG